MENTCSRLSCEELPRTRNINLFGTELSVKNTICAQDGGPYREKPDPPRLQLTICPTAYCDAACAFCIAGPSISERKIDLKILETTLLRLKEADMIRGISISGGEPFTDIGLLNETISLIFETLGFHTEVSLNTNGFRLQEMHRIRYLDYLDALHVSRHHYDDRINDSIFGRPMPSAEYLREAMHSVPYRDLFVLNCMLLKDYISTPEGVHRFMDFAISAGAGKVSFMVCTPVNDYAAGQSIPFDEVLRDEDPSLLFTRSFRDYEFCHCRDGVYCSPEGKLMEFYGRNTDTKDCDYCRGLVFAADSHLYSGFAGPRLL